MVLDKRRAYMLSIIQQSPDPVKTEELMRKIGISQRTVYYDLDQINAWLESQGLETVKNVHGQGFFLPEGSKGKLKVDAQYTFSDWEYQYSEQERILLILAKVLAEEEASSTKSFMDLTNMSRGTIVSDLKKVKKTLQQHAIHLRYQRGKGYVVEGPEEAKRTLLSDVLSRILLNKDWHTVRGKVYEMIQSGPEKTVDEEGERSEIRKLIYDAEREIGYTLTDEMVEMLSLQLMIILKRVQAGKHVEVNAEEKKVLQQTEYYKAAKKIMEKLSAQRSISFREDEVCFFTMHLLGSKIQPDDLGNYTEQEMKGLRDVVARMIRDFQSYAGVIFDDVGELEDNLVLHIKPAYYRLKYGVRIGNDLAESIQNNYKDIYQLTKRVILHLEYFVGKPVPPEEAAYITMHFIGWLAREEKQIETKYRAIIVCENGIGTSNLLKTQLENLVAGLDVTKTASVRQFLANEQEADIIFSTTFIKSEHIPIIYVPAILTNVEKEQILQQMNELLDGKAPQQERDLADEIMDVVEKHATIHERTNLKAELSFLLEKDAPIKKKEPRKPMLKELLTEQTIRFQDRASSWEEAIQIAAEPLVEQDYIQEEYIEAMIDNVKKMGAYIVIAPRIALPHARPEEGVKRLGMSLLLLKEPVHFSEKEKHRANLIIVLAAIDNQTHLKALAQLSEMLSDEENIDRLIAAASPKEVVGIIEQNESKTKTY
ncbi:BglG family transcription antiterminator [Bacillus marinisedimentorum]|uniref:BglG family transcription antiterminator n=1 Tax=Bacillus marinisedimentorum TaxID=1821260 RepID=UPI000872DDEA|nr:BglG family transcription antiterminator [Bacillus marinisedimentorum]